LRLVPAEEFARAEEKLQRAEKLAEGMPGLAAQQAHLAMYAAARGRMAASNLDDKGSHKNSQSALHDLYKDDRSNENPGKVLTRAHNWKQVDDYGGDGSIERPKPETPLSLLAPSSTVSASIRPSSRALNRPGRIRPSSRRSTTARNSETRAC
jgi:uncharacterized protein (UPF0332 family)